VPFIFYTGHGTEELMVQASIHGCFEFIDKPELVGLMEAVDRGILEGQQRRNPDRKTTLSNEEIDEFKAMINELKKKSN
jgi:FixJ family two-component response regulator